MKTLQITLVSALAAIVPIVVPAQSAPAAVARDSVSTLDRYMTTDERRATGIASLTTRQRSAFDAWLQRYTEHVIAEQALRDTALTTARAVPVGSAPPVVSGTMVAAAPASPARDQSAPPRPRARRNIAGALRITSVIDGGDAIQLQDGRVLRIYGPDHPKSSGWRRGDQVFVGYAPVMENGDEYAIIVTNTNDGSRVLAKMGTTR